VIESIRIGPDDPRYLAVVDKRFIKRFIASPDRTDYDVMGGMLGLASYGGRINTIAPDATADAKRDSVSRHCLHGRLG
jgi:hypothetical protein